MFKFKYLFSLTLLSVLSSVACGKPYNALPVDAVAPYVNPANVTKGIGSMTFMPDGLTFLKFDASGKRILSYDTATGKELSVVVDLTDTRETKIPDAQGFSLSPGGTMMLLWRDTEPVYRRSSTAQYYVLNIKRNILRPLSVEHPRQMSPVFSPDNRMVAFVAENNIYLKKLDYNSEVAVTTDGKFNEIINGIPDWTYEEEFSTSVSMTWSPESDMLCYIKYNETNVPLYSFPLYGALCDKTSDYDQIKYANYALYPGTYSYKYPVAGMTNSVVSVHAYDVDTRKTKLVEFPNKSIEYIPRITYTPDSRLFVTTLNREQNRMELYSVNPKSTVVKSILVEESKTWIEPATYEDLTLESSSFVIISARSGYNQLYRYSYAGQLLGRLTNGEWDVTAYYGTDALGNMYYQSTCKGPVNRTVTKVDRKGVATTIGEDKGTTSVNFSPAMKFYTLTYSNVKTPPCYTLFNANGKKLRVLQDNAEVSARFGGMVVPEFFTIPSGEYELNAFMWRPKDFDPRHKYPVIMWLYNGPGSQEVLDRWTMDWMQTAVEKGFIVVSVDGRGTGGRGRAFQDVVYMNLGHYETIDQCAAARYMGKQSYVDPDRIGVAGWSYGGYESLMCAQAIDSPFAAAVAIAPVTDWRFYDTVYTERYMNTPQANHEGYVESAPLNHASRLSSRLLVMSGTADDNVHMSNTIEYVSSLQASGKLCDMLLFPNKNHSIYGCGARALVYTRMLDFFMNNM